MLAGKEGGRSPSVLLAEPESRGAQGLARGCSYGWWLWLWPWAWAPWPLRDSQPLAWVAGPRIRGQWESGGAYRASRVV